MAFTSMQSKLAALAREEVTYMGSDGRRAMLEVLRSQPSFDLYLLQALEDSQADVDVKPKGAEQRFEGVDGDDEDEFEVVSHPVSRDASLMSGTSYTVSEVPQTELQRSFGRVGVASSAANRDSRGVAGIVESTGRESGIEVGPDIGPSLWEPNFDVLPWILPKALQEWVDMNFTPEGEIKPVQGRRRSLLLIGKPLTGKSEFASSIGRPDHMRARFNMSVFTEESTHMIVDDIDVRDFPVWEEVMGGQPCFNCSDKYKPMKEIPFGKFGVWLCNPDQDPRKYAPFREYIKHAGTVVVVLDKPLF